MCMHMQGCRQVEPSSEPGKYKLAPVQKLCNCLCCLELSLKISSPLAELISADCSAAWSMDRADMWLHSSLSSAASCPVFCFPLLDFSLKQLLKILLESAVGLRDSLKKNLCLNVFFLMLGKRNFWKIYKWGSNRKISNQWMTWCIL